MRTLIRALLIVVLSMAFSSMANQGLDSTEIFLSWVETEDIREFALVIDSEFSFIPGGQFRIEFSYLNWQEQQLTRVEVGPYWEDVIFEVAGTDHILGFDSIGMGMVFDWNHGWSSIPLAFTIPRQGFFYFVSGGSSRNEDVEVEGFAKIKNYYLTGPSRALEVESWVRVRPFSFHLSGLKFRKPDLLSQFIQIKIEFLQPISDSSSISCALGIDINEVVYRQNSDGEYQHFLSEDWFGEATLQNQSGALTLGFKIEEGKFRPYIRVAIDLLF